MSKKKFSQLFIERMREINRERQAHGISLSAICRGADISRATPDRYAVEVPKSVLIVDAMEEALEEAIRKKRKS